MVATPEVTASGNEITDASRAAALEGDGLTGDRSFGIWEAATNQMLNGGFEVDTADWVIQGGAVLTQSHTQAKFGHYSCKVQTGVTTWAGIVSGQVAVVAGQVWTFSAWIYRTESVVPIALLIFDQGGASVAGAAFPTDLGWVYVEKTFTVPGGDTGWEARVQKNTHANDILYYVDGVQAEMRVGNWPDMSATPYIETDGAAASRAVARVRMPASLIDETQGWVAMRCRVGWAASPYGVGNAGLFEWADGGGERLILYLEPTAPNLNATRQTGSVGNYASATYVPAIDDVFTAIFAWTATQVKVSINGAAFVTAVNNNIPTLSATAFDIGRIPVTNYLPFDGDYLWFACGTGVLTDADAVALDAAEAPGLDTILSAAVVTAIWYAATARYFVPPEEDGYDAPRSWMGG